MSHFLDYLDVRVLDENDGGRLVYALRAPFRYESDALGRTVEVPSGFVTDFESIPRLVAGLTGRQCPRAGVVHDYLYQTHTVTKAEADALYREALIVAGLDEVRAQQRYAAVDFYGTTPWATGPNRLRILTY